MIVALSMPVMSRIWFSFASLRSWTTVIACKSLDNK